jgi:hypothetical protein
MQGPDIIYFVEHVARELDVACAVASLARHRHGLRIEIFQNQYGMNQALQRCSPRLVVLPQCYKTTGDTVLVNYLPSHPEPIYFNLAWEQLHYPATSKHKAPADGFTRKHVLHHAWGEFYKDYLGHHGVPKEHVVVNGQPAYTLYDPPYCHYFAGRTELAESFRLEPEKRWVFFPENYGWAFHSDLWLNLQVEKGGLDRDVAYGLREFCRRSLELVIAWCARVAESGQIELIFRPRPLTPKRELGMMMSRVLGRLPRNLHIIKDYSVRDWTMASDVTVSSYSTTLIEAAVAGKSAYMVEPLPLPEVLVAPWYMNAAVLKTLDEFEACCISATGNEATRPLRDWARSTMMSNGDSIANLVNQFADLCAGIVQRPPVPPAELLPPLPCRPPLANAFRRTCRWLLRVLCDSKNAADFSERYEMDRFDENGVLNRVNRWNKLFGVRAAQTERRRLLQARTY